MSNVLRMFVISSNVQKLYRFLPLKQTLNYSFGMFDDKEQIKISNKVKSYNFYFGLCFDHFWENTLKIIELKVGGFNFVDISSSTFTD